LWPAGNTALHSKHQPYVSVSSHHAASVEERKSWLSAIQAAHASVAPASAPAISASLTNQEALFGNLDTSSQARLHAMFLDLQSQSLSAQPKPMARRRTASVNSSPSPSTLSQPMLDLSSTASHTHTTPDPSRLRSSSTTPQFSSDELSEVTSPLTADDAAAAPLRTLSSSPTVASALLFAKKGFIFGYNHYGRLGSLIEEAARDDPRGLDLLLVESQALEACVRKVPNFANIPAEQMRHTIESALRRTSAGGELLLKEGDVSSSMLYATLPFTQ
jgi:hypothetical protein